MMPEVEFTKIAFNGNHFKIRDHFEGRYFPNLFNLGVRVAQYEQFQKDNKEEPKWGRRQDWKKPKEHNVSFVERSSDHIKSSEENEGESSAEKTEVRAVETISGHQPYTCQMLKLSKA